MKLSRLTEYGIPERFIARWRETIGEELLDWQADAVRQHDLFGTGSLIVVAPTSSGKTFLAEMAATASLVRRRKVVYVAPLKALVAQKYERLREVFTLPPLGFRVTISTRDQRAADGKVRRGDFDIAVTVYEKFHSLILSHLDLLSTIDLVILDEPQLLGDAKRGPVVAAICDAIASVAKPPRMLLLSARLPQAEILSRYLRAPILHVHRRPVELRLGVLQEGRFHFREHNSAEVGDEIFPWNGNLPENERPIALLNELALRGERVLVFCPSKTDCHRRAQALAERRNVSIELTEDESWAVGSGPSSASSLSTWIARGVAVHHADLTSHQRTLIETLFAQGRVPVLFCTGTLAWGVNLPATAVFVDAEKFTSGPYAGRLVPIPLDRLEFEGMAGRAGRLGLNGPQEQVGRGVLWSHSECEAELLWKTYIAAEKTTLPHLVDDVRAFPIERRLLDWVVCGLVRRIDDAVRMADASPFVSANNLSLLGRGRLIAALCDEPGEGGMAVCANDAFSQYGDSTLTRPSALRAAGRPLPERERLRARASPSQNDDTWDAALDRLVRAGLIVEDPDGGIRSTPRGAVVATAGIGVDTAITITRALEASSDFDPALWVAFSTTLPEAADARLVHHALRDVAAAWMRRFSEDFLSALTRRFAHDSSVATGAFANQAAQARAMLAALVLDDWMHGVGTREIEQRYRLPVGRLEPVADTLSWIFETAGSLAATSSETARFAKDFERAAFRIRHGVPEGATDLVQALSGLLPRQSILDLIARGWDLRPSALATCDAVDLAGLAPRAVIEKVLKRCRTWAQKQITETPSDTSDTTLGLRNGDFGMRNSAIPNPRSAIEPREDVMSPILQLDGTGQRARMAVQLAGQTVMLRAKSFKYLLALAAGRMLTRDGWVNKADIEPGENQIKYFYQLRRELRAAGPRADTLIENDGSGRYRLTLPPQAIRFDLPRLATHPDWDIRSRAEQLTQAGMASQAA